MRENHLHFFSYLRSMSNWSLLADHASRTYFQIGKWPIFGPPSKNDFIVGKNPDGDGLIVDLNDRNKVEDELLYWSRDNVVEQADMVCAFAANRVIILLNEEDDDYWRVDDEYAKVGQLK